MKNTKCDRVKITLNKPIIQIGLILGVKWTDIVGGINQRMVQNNGNSNKSSCTTGSFIFTLFTWQQGYKDSYTPTFNTSKI